MRTSNRIARLLVSALLIASLGIAPGQAQDHPNHQRGFKADKVYQTSNVDSVNIFNGNLILALPIGNSYPVGGNLSFGLALTYNTQLWDFDYRCDQGDPGDRCWSSSKPHPGFNAGAGWTLSPGRLLSPATATNPSGSWVYVSGDGSSQTFFATLHQGEADDPGDTKGNQSVLYTRDGSYLRMKVENGQRIVEMGNGIRQHFVPGPADEWLLIKIDDPFANEVAVSYHPNAAAYTEQRFTDSHGRQQRIFFLQTADPLFPRLVQRVELTAVGGAIANWNFQTQWVTVPRGCPHNDPDIPDTGVSIPLLTRVTLPDGSAYRMPVSDYNVPSSPGSCTNTSGRIKGLGLPTGGKIEWTYTSYSFPAGDSHPHPDPTSPPPWETATGVGTRTLKRADGSVIGTWIYTPSLTNWPGTPQDPWPNELQVEVRDPLGHETVHFFSVDRDSTAWNGEYTIRDYGLPFTRDAPSIVISDPFDGSQNIEMLLSRQVYDAGGTLMRSHYVAYERDPTSVGIEDAQNCNRRPRAERTVFEDDNNFVETIRADFDGLGHFRKSLTRGDFQNDDGRTGITQFNPQRGTYAVDNSGNPLPGYTPLPASAPWILGTYAYQDRSENLQQNRLPETDDSGHPGFQDFDDLETVVIGRTETTFDAQTGFLQCRRRLAVGTSRGTSDILDVFEPDGDGNVHIEKSYGGDLQNLPTGAGCNPGGLPAQPEYIKRHDYDHGVVSHSAYLESCGQNNEFLQIADFTIDPSTGLVLRSTDTSGLDTFYTYDAQGRILSEEPAEEAGTFYNYVIADPAAGIAARVEASRRISSGSTPLTEQRFLYDGQGRLCREEARRPDGGWAARDHIFWATNWRKESTELLSATPRNSCRSSLTGLARQTFEYDSFGRVTRMVPADGGAHDVEINYLGVRQIKRRVHIATGSNGSETEVHTVERYNPHGQLRKVLENFNGTPQVLTEYAYDVDGNLRQVAQDAQTRNFSRDRRGFLKSQQLPELGSNGQGSRTFDTIDSMGKVRQMSEGDHRLLYSYDAAGRLTHIDEVVDTTGNGHPDAQRRLEERSYYRDNPSGELSRGKLHQAKRHNYGAPVGPLFMAGADLIVSENYRYGGRSGRVSERQTRLSNRGKSTAFTQSFTYNDLGLMASQTYPRCLQAPCAGNDPARTTTYQYAEARLVGVPGWADQLKYHPNGLLSEVRHSNGVTDVQLNDPQSMGRPRRISFSGPSVNWTPGNGDYQYDGVGNIKAIGVDSYRYDVHNRLTHATLASTGNQSQSMTYDRYGNVTQIVRNGVPSSVPIVAASNHLGGSAVYDDSGNLTYQLAGGQPQQLTYDSQNRVQSLQTPEVAKGFVYTVDGERLVEIDFGDPWTETWSVRDPSGKVVRQWKHVPSGSGGLGNWTWHKDYIYRDGMLLASVNTMDGVRHHHLDHLGSPRLITDSAGVEVARHTYFPFGEEATDPNQDSEPMKFTGHERDLNGPGTADDLDYMHARYYSPGLCRFLSVDPADSAKAGVPQSWNMYVYVGNSPMAYVDPNGQERAMILLDQDIEEFLSGEITADQYMARIEGRGTLPAIVVTLIAPIDEVSVGGLLVEAGVTAGLRVAARVGGFFKKLFRGAKKVQSPGVGLKIPTAGRKFNQIERRGWTEASLQGTVQNPHATRAAANKASGNPATAYFNKDGSHVVVDDLTGDLVQMSDRTNPNAWVPDPTIQNPYLPPE